MPDCIDAIVVIAIQIAPARAHTYTYYRLLCAFEHVIVPQCCDESFCSPFVLRQWLLGNWNSRAVVSKKKAKAPFNRNNIYQAIKKVRVTELHCSRLAHLPKEKYPMRWKDHCPSIGTHHMYIVYAYTTFSNSIKLQAYCFKLHHNCAPFHEWPHEQEKRFHFPFTLLWPFLLHLFIRFISTFSLNILWGKSCWCFFKSPPSLSKISTLRKALVWSLYMYSILS